MNEDVLIPAIIFFSIFGYLAWRRFLEYRETVALAEHGMVRQRKPSDGKDSLRWGILLAALGLALTIGLYPFGWLLSSQAGVSFPLGFGPWLLVGLVPLFFGLGLILMYLIIKPDPNSPPPANGDGASLAMAHRVAVPASEVSLDPAVPSEPDASATPPPG